ncbi:MAG: dienelactone hydrolase family protein [Novosphingobium sp.]|nr:dienelactone hydrolase family protein [Novosphingobium sp.]
MQFIFGQTRQIAALAGLCLALLLPQTALAAHHESAAVMVERSYVDETRSIKASMGFAGSETRQLDIKVWYPKAQAGGPLPLIIYSHGTFGFAKNAMHIVNALVEAGYVVAAANYPLTSRNAFTKINFADITDTSNQVKDISFIIDSLLADPELSKRIDPERIGATGISLGAVTSYFASFGARTRDPRIKASAPIAGGDPVQTALDNAMGFAGAGNAAIPVPVLFLSADRDVFARVTGRPHAAYSRVETPKYEVMIKDGVHVWFGDNVARPADNKNPDCIFFETNMPSMKVPGCELRDELIVTARQKEITRAALIAFFNAYLKDDAEALESLQTIGDGADDIELIFEE